MRDNSENLLTPEFLKKIEQLELVSRKVLAGRMKGERRSKQRGFSTEFADHRPYVVGDDLRFIDWNILIRLDRLFLKLFEEEEDLHFHVLIDSSKSMDFGEPTKFLYAKRLAAALVYIALVNLDRVAISAFSDQIVRSIPAARGRQSLMRVLDQLSSLPVDAGSNLAAACKSIATRTPSKGVVILLSDLMDKAGFENGLRYLIARQFDVYVIQILCQEEIDPQLAGDLALIDSEDGEVAEITVSAPLLKRYKQNLQAFCTDARQYCAQRGVTYALASNQIPFEHFVLKHLQERGLVR